MQEKEKKDIFKKMKNQWPMVGIIFFIIIFFFIGGLFVFDRVYAESFYPGVKIGYLEVGGKTKIEVQAELEKIEENIQNKGLVFKSGEKEVVINPIVISASPDLAKEILALNINQTMGNAYDSGRQGNFFTNALNRLAYWVIGKDIPIIYSLNEETLLDHLQVNFSELESPPVNASLDFNDSQVKVIGEKSGFVFDYQKAIVELRKNIESLNFKTVNMELVFAEPVVKQAEAQAVISSIENLLQADFISLSHDGNYWRIDQATLISWLEFQKLDDAITIGVNKEKAEEFLKEVATDINVTAIDAKFELKGNRVSEFQSSRDGKKLNIEESYSALNDQIQNGVTADLELSVEVDPAKVATSDLNDLGITDLLGRGTSNFSGSPVNRRHNIKVGVDSLDGILIAPGEDFSLMEALGEIDGEHGYLQELVIKGNRTIPEYGGGLCQIGSTTFRAALWSGLPITARRNHSYRVRYYEPAGMDATIYDPAPDMRFLNDTGHHILFIARMEGDDLIFEFYGKPDGRQVSIEPNPPAIYNITQPGPPRYIETDDLAPGEKKKVESAHAGADTYFKYTITYPDGRVAEQDFYSHYVAWPEVWLLGREPSATSTEEIISTE